MSGGTLRRWALCMIVGLLAAGAIAAEEIGEVSALADSLAIIRYGELFPGAVEGGVPLEAEDLLFTEEGFAEVVLTGLGRLRLWPETVVHLRGAAAERELAEAETAEAETAGAESDTAQSEEITRSAVEIELLSGNVTFLRLGGSEPVALLSGPVQLMVRAGEVTLGAYAGGIRLVVSEGGRQMVRSEAGETRFAEPDLPVGYDGRLSNIDEAPLVWRGQRLRRFGSLGPGAMAERFQAYLDLRDRFDEAYEELLNYRRLLNRWSFRNSRDLPLMVDEDLEETPGLAGAISRILSVGEPMEARYYQLRLDAPYLPEEYREHLANEEAFLPERLHFVRFLRAVTELSPAAEVTD